MSENADRSTREGALEAGRPTDRATTHSLLYTALQDTLDTLLAMGAAVYFTDEDGEALGTVMLVGTPPAIFIMDDRVGPDSPYATAKAFRDNNVVTHDMTDSRYTGRFPYSLAAAPIAAGERRFGVLTLLRTPSSGPVLEPEQADWLRNRCVRLAEDLRTPADHGFPMVPSTPPVLIPMYPPPSPGESRATYWGLPDIRQSIGISQMYQVRRLNEALNQAETAKDAVAAAESHMMVPFNGQEIALTIVDRGRLWVVGHGGELSESVRHLNGSSMTANTPMAETLGGRPIFLNNLNSRLAMYPDSLDAGEGSWAYLPVILRTRLLGVCCMSFSTARDFTPDEQAIMMMMAELLGAALERIQLNDTGQRLAESLQRSLLPGLPHDYPEVNVATRYLPAASLSGCGGDWYDVVRLPDGRIAMIVGDVEGHGLESSAIMGQVRTAVLAYASEGHGASEVMTRAGRLFESLGTELLATCCVGLLDPVSGAFETCLAGHPPPVAREPDGHLRLLLAPTGLPLGAGGAAYETSTDSLEPGSLVLLYTNGIIYGEHWDASSAAQSLLATLEEGVPDNVEQTADDFVATLPRSGARDDAVLLLAHYEGAGATSHGRTDRMEIHRRDLQGVKESRRFVRHNLISWGLESAASPMELIMSELATNALIHADSDVELRLREFEDRVRLEVRDSDVSPPTPSAVFASDEDNEQAESGRGLLIVAALSSVFGSSPNGRGKTVWAEVPKTT